MSRKVGSKSKVKLIKGDFKGIFVKNRDKIFYFVLGIIDIILIIYVARSNIANYAIVNGEEVFIGSSKNLIMGRNYITLVISLFIYLYGLIVNKFLLKKKISNKWLILILILILIFNMIMFYLFTKKVY